MSNYLRRAAQWSSDWIRYVPEGEQSQGRIHFGTEPKIASPDLNITSNLSISFYYRFSDSTIGESDFLFKNKYDVSLPYNTIYPAIYNFFYRNIKKYRDRFNLFIKNSLRNSGANLTGFPENYPEFPSVLNFWELVYEEDLTSIQYIISESRIPGNFRPPRYNINYGTLTGYILERINSSIPNILPTVNQYFQEDIKQKNFFKNTFQGMGRTQRARFIRNINKYFPEPQEFAQIAFPSFELPENVNYNFTDYSLPESAQDIGSIITEGITWFLLRPLLPSGSPSQFPNLARDPFSGNQIITDRTLFTELGLTIRSTNRDIIEGGGRFRTFKDISSTIQLSLTKRRNIDIPVNHNDSWHYSYLIANPKKLIRGLSGNS